MIDFHCHLDLYPDPQAVVAGCIRANLDVLSVTTTPRAWAQTLAMSRGAPRVLTALGLHPELASQRKEEVALLEELLPTTRFVGEVGLDGSPELRATWSDQRAVFRRILDACDREGGRILSVHSRRAAGPVLDCLAESARRSTTVLHWFSGTLAELKRAVELGCWFSVGRPMLTSTKGRALVAAMPQERVLTETDGPFVQENGRPIMPWEVADVVAELGVLWQVPTDGTQQQLNSNLSQLLADPPSA